MIYRILLNSTFSLTKMTILVPLYIVVTFVIQVNKLWCFWCRSKVCLVGKTAIVTGGASGIGFEAALALAAKGCRIIIADVENLEKAVEDMKKESHNTNIVGMKLDLQSFKSVREFVKDVIQSESRLDILVCNAGIACFRKRVITEDGLDRTMQSSSPSRITFTSSIAAYISTLTIDKLGPDSEVYDNFLNKWNGGIYSNSKLCMAAAAKLFGDKLIGTEVTANAVYPGGVKTRIYKDFMQEVHWDTNYLNRLFTHIAYRYVKTPEEGAQTLIHIAHSDELKYVTGQSFVKGFRVPGPPQLTKDFCNKLWDVSIELTKLQPNEIKC